MCLRCILLPSSFPIFLKISRSSDVEKQVEEGQEEEGQEAGEVEVDEER